MNWQLRWRGRLLFLSLTGYPIVAALTSLAGTESSIPSVVIRTLVAALGIVLFIGSPVRLDVAGRVFVIAWAGFWTIYLCRVLYDGFAHKVLMPLSGPEYLVYALTFSILPALGALGPLDARSERRLLVTILVTLGGTLLLSAYATFSALSNLAALLSNRVQLEKLNPISIGMLGGSMLVLVVCLWSEQAPRGWLARLLSFVALLIAIAALGLSGSKGPLLATMLTLMVHYSLPLTPAKLIKLIGGAAVLAGLMLAAIPILAQNVDIALISRLDSLVSGQSVDPSNTLHLLAYEAAWSQFVSSPIWGDAIVENALHYYPHNLFLDVAMSTGLLGLTSFGLILVFSLTRTYRQLSVRAPYRWVFLINVLNIAGAQVSGGIFQASEVWFFMISAFFVNANGRSIGQEMTSLPFAVQTSMTPRTRS